MFIGRFIARLSDGRRVLEMFPHESIKGFDGYLRMGWTDLSKFCSKNNLHIIKLHMHFGHFTHKAPDGAEKYYQNMQQTSVSDITNELRRGLGFLKDGKWFITWINENGNICDMEVRSA